MNNITTAPSERTRREPWPKVEPDHRTIVVGVDGRPGGWQALAWAADEADRAGDRLLVCRVYPPGSAGAVLPASPAPDRLAIADPVLAEALANLAARLGGDRVLLRIGTGDPAHLLRELADRAGMVVVSASTSHRPPLSTVAGQLAAHASSPVIAVRPVPDVAGPFPGEVIVGVDRPGPAEVALKFGFEYAARHHIALTAVHVGAGPASEGGVWVDDDMLETHLVVPSSGLDLLDREVNPWHHRFPAVPLRRAVLPGNPGKTLASVSRGARLLVVGDRGRPAPVRLLLGSVSQAVLAGGSAPVAVVHRIPPVAPNGAGGSGAAAR